MASAKDSTLIRHLKTILGPNVESDIVNYISSIKKRDDFEEFMENILDRSNSSHMAAYNGIKQIILDKKPNPNQTQSSSKSNKQNDNQQGRKREKKHFKNIDSFEETRKRQEGRVICDCLGQEHEFMNNCLQCGRIHCMEEGPGPCLFCGNMISLKGEANIMNPKVNIKHRQNKVFDDDNDYFKMKNKKDNKEAGKKMVIALDFASRRVVETTQEDEKIRRRLLEDSLEHLKKVENMYKTIQENSEMITKHKISHSDNDDLVDLLIHMRHRKPQTQEDLGAEDSTAPILNYGSNVLDETVVASIDHGLCLSMHQPYASLLVAGVKKHEGRTWPTTHRGRLWIAAAAKQPEEDEIQQLEQFYRSYYNDTTLKFPKEYPTGCLLGCVNIEDCLEQEVYRKRYPEGESYSPYVFICSNPIILPIFYPIAGKHKIYELDKDLHKCVKIALQHAKYVS